MTIASKRKTWGTLDPEDRRELDAQYLRELSMWSHPGLSEEGVDAYLDYRHERPDHAITTFEEGKIRALLRSFTDRSRLADPVAAEEHRGRLVTAQPTCRTIVSDVRRGRMVEDP